mmetsp:Transcript_70452/g.166029  ORF Transcript_70452/g.166029 Transcript_70452/m.166029 type:complete len:365 (+) Transcript_70452:1681-2775(+)
MSALQGLELGDIAADGPAATDIEQHITRRERRRGHAAPVEPLHDMECGGAREAVPGMFQRLAFVLRAVVAPGAQARIGAQPVQRGRVRRDLARDHPAQMLDHRVVHQPYLPTGAAVEHDEFDVVADGMQGVVQMHPLDAGDRRVLSDPEDQVGHVEVDGWRCPQRHGHAGIGCGHSTDPQLIERVGKQQAGAVRLAVLGDADAAAHAGLLAGFNIGGLVAEHQRAAQVDAQRLGAAQDHAGRGLAAVAVDGVARHAAVGQVRAVLDGGQRDALCGQVLAQRVVQRLDGGLVVVAARDAGLVGHDDQRVAGGLQPAQRVDGAGDVGEVGPAVDIAVVDVDDAVAVEEGGGAHQRFRMRLTSAVVE